MNIPLEQRRFRLLKNGGRDSGADILGGEVEWGNAHVCFNTTVVRGKEKHELAVNESTIVVGAICFRKCERGEKESYKLLRTV